MEDTIFSFSNVVEACIEMSKRLAGRAIHGAAFRFLIYPVVSGVWSSELLIYVHSCPGICQASKCVNVFKFDAGRLVKMTAKELKLFFKAAGSREVYVEIDNFTCTEMLDELEQLGADADSLKEADIISEIRRDLSYIIKALGAGKLKELDTCWVIKFFQNNLAPFLCFIFNEDLSLLVARPEFVAASLLKVSRALSEKEPIGDVMIRLGDALGGWGKPTFLRMVITEKVEGALGGYSRITIDAILSYEGMGFSITAVLRGENAVKKWSGIDAIKLLLKGSHKAMMRCSDLSTTMFVTELEPSDISIILGSTLRMK